MSVSRQIKWRGKSLMQKVDVLIAENLKTAGQVLKDDIKGTLNVRGADFSQPGEPPRTRSKRLLKSIRAKVDRSGGGLRLIVGSNAPHWHLLEFGTVNMEARPYLRPAFDRFRGQAERIVGKGFAVRLT